MNMDKSETLKQKEREMSKLQSEKGKFIEESSFLFGLDESSSGKQRDRFAAAHY